MIQKSCVLNEDYNLFHRPIVVKLMLASIRLYEDKGMFFGETLESTLADVP